MQLKLLILVCLQAALLGAYHAQQARFCERPTQLSGIISYSASRNEPTPGYDSYTTPGYDSYTTPGYDSYTTAGYDYTTVGYDDATREYIDNKCWFIRTPQEYYIRLSIVEMNLKDPNCDYARIEVEDDAGKRARICQRDSSSENYTFLGDVTVTVVNDVTYWRRESSFKMKYHIESVACARNDSFRCSQNQCIYPDQVCDGKEDCANGIDEGCEIPVVRGVNATRNRAISWLKRRQTETGWGRNTHRAVTALYLSGANKFRGARTEEEIIVKELQLKAMAALLRNTTSVLSVNELSMYVNSLMVTCHDLRNFYGYDLLKILSSRVFASPSPSPGAYLTLCNAGWPLPENSVPRLLQLLEKDSGYPFAFEIRAMTVMALSCIRQKNEFDRNWYEVYNGTIENFLANQRDDGSFGNAHTTAMVSQALISSGILSEQWQWDYVGAVRYLMRNVNSSSADFLSVYLSLPIFNGKTLLNVGSVDCSDFQRKFENDDEDVSEVVDRMGGNASVQYSLYIGNNKEVVQTIYLKVPQNSTALDVMKLAQMADHKYKFSSNKMSDHVYVYKIGGMSNDMEVGKFWFLFKAADRGELDELYTTSPDQIVMNNGDHLIMWYKMADF